MFSKLRQALGKPRSATPRTRTRYHWRCECGAHSRGPDGWGIYSDARYNADRHTWSKKSGHPKAEVYTTVEALA